jgi:hypothetical protein
LLCFALFFGSLDSLVLHAFDMCSILIFSFAITSCPLGETLSVLFYVCGGAGERGAEERRIAKLVIKLLLTIPLVLLVFTVFFFIQHFNDFRGARAAL